MDVDIPKHKRASISTYCHRCKHFFPITCLHPHNNKTRQHKSCTIATHGDRGKGGRLVLAVQRDSNNKIPNHLHTTRWPNEQKRPTDIAGYTHAWSGPILNKFRTLIRTPPPPAAPALISFILTRMPCAPRRKTQANALCRSGGGGANLYCVRHFYHSRVVDGPLSPGSSRRSGRRRRAHLIKF